MTGYCIAWDRAGLVNEHDFARRYSRQHIHTNTGPYTLCGARPRWAHETPGDGRRCSRCFAIAAKRGLRDEHGSLIAGSADA